MIKKIAWFQWSESKNFRSRWFVKPSMTWWRYRFSNKPLLWHWQNRILNFIIYLSILKSQRNVFCYSLHLTREENRDIQKSLKNRKNYSAIGIYYKYYIIIKLNASAKVHLLSFILCIYIVLNCNPESEYLLHKSQQTNNIINSSLFNNNINVEQMESCKLLILLKGNVQIDK